MNRPLLSIYATVALDAVGIGLIFPILPALLRDVSHNTNVALCIGLLAALYAVMQFIFAPMLGALSDRLGRRPVLLLSLSGAAINYLFLAFAPNLWLLFVGRAIAGLSSANMSVATAYITDISPPETRARRFGLFNAMFGAGFIIGPVLGGALGDHWVRLPFIAAAVLNAGNLILAVFVLPESRKTKSRKPESRQPAKTRVDFDMLNPLQPLRGLSMRGLWPFVCLFFVFSTTGEAYGVCWALWGRDAFHWNGLWIGLSLGAFGLCQTLAQAFLPGPAVKWLGERRAVLTGVAAAIGALIVMALARHGWIVFAIMPVFALGGIGVPALQSLASRQVGEDRQGQLQGVLASTVSLASIVGPLAFSNLYGLFGAHWPGAVWLSVVAVYVVTIPLIIGLPLPPSEAVK